LVLPFSYGGNQKRDRHVTRDEQRH
jgi:hypothetical protein